MNLRKIGNGIRRGIRIFPREHDALQFLVGNIIIQRSLDPRAFCCGQRLVHCMVRTSHHTADPAPTVSQAIQPQDFPVVDHVDPSFENSHTLVCYFHYRKGFPFGKECGSLSVTVRLKLRHGAAISPSQCGYDAGICSRWYEAKGGHATTSAFSRTFFTIPNSFCLCSAPNSFTKLTGLSNGGLSRTAGSSIYHNSMKTTPSLSAARIEPWNRRGRE